MHLLPLCESFTTRVQQYQPDMHWLMMMTVANSCTILLLDLHNSQRMMANFIAVFVECVLVVVEDSSFGHMLEVMPSCLLLSANL